MAKEGCCWVLCILFICYVGCVLSVNVTSGTNNTFKPETLGTIKSIEWRVNNRKNLIVEWDDPNEPIWYRYQNRAKLDTKTGELTIYILEKSDSGQFDFQYHTGGPIHHENFTLNVFDKVTKPKVTCQENEKTATLLCSLHPSVVAAFTWGGPNGLSHSGESLQVIRKENDDDIYYCTATNEVSKETAEFKLQLCSSDAHKINVGAIVGPIVTIIVLGAVGAAFYLKKKKAKPDKRSDPSSTNDTQDPDATVPLDHET